MFALLTIYGDGSQADMGTQVWRHCIGSTAEQDELVFHEKDEQFYTNLGKSKDEKILIIHVGRLSSNKVAEWHSNQTSWPAALRLASFPMLLHGMHDNALQSRAVAGAVRVSFTTCSHKNTPNVYPSVWQAAVSDMCSGYAA